jgi:hypothetical protein
VNFIAKGAAEEGMLRGNLPYSDLLGLPGCQSPEEKRAIESAIAPAGRAFHVEGLHARRRVSLHPALVI